MVEHQFDEKAQTALRQLFERFWVLREKDPALYQMIREREKVLKRYVEEKFGFDLIVHQHFIKLEKIPVEAKSWMGIQGFQKPLDYAIFCCALALTESKTVDQQFLLSTICEDIKDMYPGEFGIDWTNYNHRRSLIRVMKQLENLSILRVVEGIVDQFALDAEKEVLYEVTVYARYFMRSYPKDLFEYETKEEILEHEWVRHTDDLTRKRVYRKLMLSPAVMRTGEDDADFAYIRNYRNRLRDDLEEHTLFRFEIFKNVAFLVAGEKKQEWTLFPDQKAITDIALHFAHVVRDNLSELTIDAYGGVTLTTVQFTQIMENLHARYGKGWSKQYRDGTTEQVIRDVISLLMDWEMLTKDVDTGHYLLKPSFGRMIGAYPLDFWEKEEKNVTKQQTT